MKTLVSCKWQRIWGALVFVGGLVGGCAGGESDAVSEAEQACLQLCQRHVEQYHTNLSKGPCLSDPLAETQDHPAGMITPDFVCDVAHQPRTASDNETDNQCQAYLDGRAQHFIEVSTDCTTIRVQ